ncbi:hypothetical protein B296_00038557 [Ensete ventricosum]|uniref:Uncharacterized protein n=1 Tax=Ensete ventricosum TaxID=4639 RepID=A0A426Y0B9_ENSVE|nr:hypothetical protein B296_00038557 [Ensete ventricosum]
MNRVRYYPSGSSSFCLIPRRDITIGLGCALARKFDSNIWLVGQRNGLKRASNGYTTSVRSHVGSSKKLGTL